MPSSNAEAVSMWGGIPFCSKKTKQNKNKSLLRNHRKFVLNLFTVVGV